MIVYGSYMIVWACDMKINGCYVVVWGSCVCFGVLDLEFLVMVGDLNCCNVMIINGY